MGKKGREAKEGDLWFVFVFIGNGKVIIIISNKCTLLTKLQTDPFFIPVYLLYYSHLSPLLGGIDAQERRQPSEVIRVGFVGEF